MILFFSTLITVLHTMPCSHHSCFYRSFDLHAALGSFLNHLHGSKEAKEETTFLFLFLFASGVYSSRIGYLRQTNRAREQ
jgi:hypothetical protein